MKNMPIIAAISALSLGIGAAHAAPPAAVGSSTPQSFSDHDLNQDGRINRQEAAGSPELRHDWEMLDSNRDGAIDQAEFARFEADETDNTEEAE